MKVLAKVCCYGLGNYVIVTNQDLATANDLVAVGVRLNISLVLPGIGIIHGVRRSDGAFWRWNSNEHASMS